jgi:uncharacterized protein YbjT (DUF2867 family)
MKVIITGATGMVGEGVLHVCLQHTAIEQVLIVNRKPAGVQHPKLKEVIHQDFYDLSAVEEHLKGYDACFFCLGVSSVGMKEADYTKVTYTLTMHFGQTVARLNPGMVFCYVSGAGTDSTEQSRLMWARVKGRTENHLMGLDLQAYAIRPGFIKPIPGLQHINPLYKYINWIFPIGRWIYPRAFCTMQELALAMIHVAGYGYQKKVLEGDDLIALGKS